MTDTEREYWDKHIIENQQCENNLLFFINLLRTLLKTLAFTFNR